MMNAIGLDLGTTTLSAVVVDADTGDVRRTLTLPNEAALTAGQSWERAQDADQIALAAERMLARLKAECGPVATVGIDGQMHGMLYVDADGRAVSPLYTWQDQRGEQPLEGGTYASRLSELSGYPVATGYGTVTHAWHIMRDAVPAAAAGLCAIGDYVGMRLTGRKAPLLHVSTAASFGLFDATTGGWDTSALARVGVDAAFLPETTDQAVLVGRDRDGVPVSCAVGDNQASFIGSMRDMDRALLVNMGTGGQASMLSDARGASGDVESRPLGAGLSILVGSALCGGRSYALLERFLRSCAALAGYDGGSLYMEMNRAGMAALDGGALPRVDTRFHGTRKHPELRGAVNGLGTDNFDAAHLIGGTLMGMAEELHGLYMQMTDAGALPAVKLIGSGNAIRRNPALRRAFERVFDLELRIPAHTEEAAYGAALFSMVACGLKPSLSDAQRLIRYA